MMQEIRTIVSGLSFAEAPRWHDGALYITDMFDNRVLRIDEGGTASVVARFDAPVSGLGWLPDGRMLAVSMEARQVLRQEEDSRFVLHADLSGIATYHANDMIVTEDGTAYVGNFGFSLHPPEEPRMATLAKISPSGTTTAVAEDLFFPNGMAVTPDNGTLIVAETGGCRIVAFNIGSDGALAGRRIWADLGAGVMPDGMCLDEEGAVWVALPLAKEFVRVREGGEVVDRIQVADAALACVLGGPDRRTLYLMTSGALDPESCRTQRNASVLAVGVETPGAGRP